MNTIYNEFTEPRTRTADRLTWKDLIFAAVFLILFYFAGLILWACLA